MRKFQAAVEQLGDRAPSGASLRRMFAYWESGERAVSVDTYRRAFMTMYDVPAEVLGLSGDSAPRQIDLEQLRQELDVAITSGPQDVEIWERLVARYGYATRDAPASLLLADLADDLASLRRALDTCQTVSGKRSLVRVVAQMSGLMLLTLVKLDERAAFRRWAATARTAAREAEDPATRSWVLAQEAYGHFYSDDLAAALDVAQGAQQIAGTTACVGAPLAAALEARTWALRGEAESTRRALARAEQLVAGLDEEEQVPSAFGYNEAQLRFHAGSAYTRLRDPERAQPEQVRALELCASGDYTDGALTRLDRADCLVFDGQIELGVHAIVSTLSGLNDSQRQGIIDLRAREIVTGLTPEKRSFRPVRELVEQWQHQDLGRTHL